MLGSVILSEVICVQERRFQVFTAWLVQAAEPRGSPTALGHICKSQGCVK